ncbi:RIP metalloprotease RseP [Polymorphobacter arshaanensis]|uniref:Zinc metalloprotease n=1 Tax=Glacieibacterium arshaanense TaxID=2511025 RepID=A0A4Y9ERH6_9SPHN|nr:RIP metalloprotease RseP [Polymorphobacter arshaanensis]TFU06247.1 RIP metalloprotease RseP [Polymorphobacter arshaanensis]
MIAQPGFLFTLAAFIVVIGVLVFIHEAGHYLMARVFGIKADTFSIGFGREIAGWTDKRGTRWKLSALPLGGYVKFAGDLNAASEPDPDAAQMPPEEYAKTFQAKPMWQRALVILAGPLTNFLFAILVFAVFFMTYGHAFTPAIINGVQPGSPAAVAGLQTGDKIIALDGQTVERFEDVVRVVTINPGTPIDARISRDGVERQLTITPKVVAETDRFGNAYTRGMLGVTSAGRIVERRSPVAAVYFAVQETWLLTRTMADTLVQVVTGRRAVNELGGPLKIAQFTGQQATLGLPNLVQFMALISINLGFINLLPIPMLDGGHLFLYAVEAIRRRPLEAKVQEWAFMSGFAALLTLMLFLTWNDLASVGVWKHLSALLG